MKAKAPEKIYIQLSKLDQLAYQNIVYTKPLSDNSMEYTRTGAVIPTSTELKEYEKTRKSLIILLQHFCKGYRVPGLDFPVSYKDMLDWVEKQSQVKESIISKHENKTCKEIDDSLTSDNEKIKKEIISYLKYLGKYCQESVSNVNKCIAWLEKQGDKIVDCQQSHQDVKHPNGGIVMEDFNGGEGFYKLHLDYLNKKQVEEIEEMIRVWNKELETPNEQNSAWSKEDEIGLRDALWAIEQARTIAKDENDMGNLWYAERWLKLLKERLKGE